jgi:hypothetical protein
LQVLPPVEQSYSNNGEIEIIDSHDEEIPDFCEPPTLRLEDAPLPERENFVEIYNRHISLIKELEANQPLTKENLATLILKKQQLQHIQEALASFAANVLTNKYEFDNASKVEESKNAFTSECVKMDYLLIKANEKLLERKVISKEAKIKNLERSVATLFKANDDLRQERASLKDKVKSLSGELLTLKIQQNVNLLAKGQTLKTNFLASFPINQAENPVDLGASPAKRLRPVSPTSLRAILISQNKM